MPEIVQNPLAVLSEALAERARLARPLVVAIRAAGHRTRSGTLWRKDVVVTSEQVFPDVGEATVKLEDGRMCPARVVGRDPGTNVAALRVDGSVEPTTIPAREPHPGTLALTLGADDDGVSVRLGVVHSAGPAWHSRAGGRIDRRITLDIALRRYEEGGPVVDSDGGLLGISTLGPGRRVLVIPHATVESVVDALLAQGRVERGWLGVALQPVAVPDELQSKAGQSRGLMIMGVAKDGPAAQAGVHIGDILLTIGGESITRPAVVAQRLGQDSVGQQIALQLMRAGNLLSLPAKVGVRPPK
jgi:S1-C subfamily serine protease